MHQYQFAFTKALVQVQERVTKDWRTYEKCLLHKKAFLNYSHHKRLSNEETAVLVKHDYNPPFIEVKPKRLMLICDNCQENSVYTYDLFSCTELAWCYQNDPLERDTILDFQDQ